MVQRLYFPCDDVVPWFVNDSFDDFVRTICLFIQFQQLQSLRAILFPQIKRLIKAFDKVHLASSQLDLIEGR